MSAAAAHNATPTLNATPVLRVTAAPVAIVPTTPNTDSRHPVTYCTGRRNSEAKGNKRRPTTTATAGKINWSNPTAEMQKSIRASRGFREAADEVQAYSANEAADGGASI
jgi:hypothetical protein